MDSLWLRFNLPWVTLSTNELPALWAVCSVIILVRFGPLAMFLLLLLAFLFFVCFFSSCFKFLFFRQLMERTFKLITLFSSQLFKKASHFKLVKRNFLIGDRLIKMFRNISNNSDHKQCISWLGLNELIFNFGNSLLNVRW